MQAREAQPRQSASIPFNSKRLDLLMDDAGVDVLLITSKHNVQYMLGGHKALFFGVDGCVGIRVDICRLSFLRRESRQSRFLSRIRPSTIKRRSVPFRISESPTSVSGSEDAMRLALEYLRKLGVMNKRIGIEFRLHARGRGDHFVADLPPEICCQCTINYGEAAWKKDLARTHSPPRGFRTRSGVHVSSYDGPRARGDKK